MAYLEVPVRGFTLMLNYVVTTNGGQTAVNQAIGGLTNIALDESSKTSDVTNFDDQGNERSIIMSRTRSMKIAGAYREDPQALAVEPGFLALRSLAKGFGNASTGNFTLTSPIGKTRTFNAVATINSWIAGGNDDIAKWTATLDVSGAINES